MAPGDAAQPANLIERTTTRKVMWRIVPFTFLIYIISYIDRANISFAALQMNQELALSAQAFGLAAGMFFIGFLVFEIPSNIMLLRFGARLWIARILVTWGICAAATAFAQNGTQLVILRFLLGAAEAGFYPAIIAYFAMWFRNKERATAISLFTLAIPVSFIISAPLSTFLMDALQGVYGWGGWRWMLLLEALPAILGGIAAYYLILDRVELATWLSREEAAWLTEAIAREQSPSNPHLAKLGIWQSIVNLRVMYLSFIYFVAQCGNLGITYWMPQIVKSLSSAGLSNLLIGLISTIPYVVSSVGMIVWARSSDATGERKMHCSFAQLVGGVGLVGAGFASSPALGIFWLCVALTGIYAFKAPFFALPNTFLSPSTAVVSVAVIVSFGNLGGFVGPYLIGYAKDMTGSTTGGLYAIAALLILSAVMMMLTRLRPPAPAVESSVRPGFR